MQNCNKKKKCLVGPNAGIAFTPGDECDEGETFDSVNCDCILYAEAECNCANDCPSGFQCLNGECVSEYWIWIGRTDNAHSFAPVQESDWTTGGSLTPIRLTSGNQWPALYASNQTGTVAPQKADVTPLNPYIEGETAGTCTGNAMTFHLARFDTNYQPTDSLYEQQTQTIATVACTANAGERVFASGTWIQADSNGVPL